MRFPSPQVGSELSSRFPLTDKKHVSIPSSRVGTKTSRLAAPLFGLFPSPQVGSELLGKASDMVHPSLFPSPQVGSEQEFFAVAKRPDLGFHPLKSGRNVHLR